MDRPVHLLPGDHRGAGVGRPNIRNRSYAIAVDVDIQTPEAEGVLFSHGARFGGHSLYVKDRKLKYVYQLRRPQRADDQVDVRCSDRQRPSAVFEREGDSMPATGSLSLYMNDEKVGEGRITTQPGNFSLVGEGLNVGKDPAEPVTDDYPGTRPYAFTGGTIRHAIVDLSGEPFLDLEREAAAMMARE